MLLTLRLFGDVFTFNYTLYDFIRQLTFQMTQVLLTRNLNQGTRRSFAWRAWTSGRETILVHTWYSIQRCSLVEIELHYAAHQLTVQSVRCFVNGSHHFYAAQSGLHTNIESSCNTISCLASCSAIIVYDSQHFILLLAEYIIPFVVQCSAVAIYGLFFSQYVSTILQLSRTKANHSRVCSTSI